MLSLPDFKARNVIICFASDNQRVSFKNDNLIITDSSGKIILQNTCHRIFSLWICGPVTITSGLLERSRKFGFSILLLSYSHKLYGLWSSTAEGNFILRKRQYEYTGIELARSLVKNKILNQTRLLQSIRQRSDALRTVIAQMNGYALKCDAADNLPSLLGLEGSASRLYFSHWFLGMGWSGRKPRAKTDYINTILDIGYTYLFNFLDCMLTLYGFDLYQGVYHRCFYQRKSLVCDLVEPFRCIIDKQVKRAYGLNQLNENDFVKRSNQYFLKPEKNKEYIKWIFESILNYKDEIFVYVQEYYRSFIRNKPANAFPDFNINSLRKKND